MTLPVPAPTTFTVSQILTAARLNTDLRDAILFLTNPPIFVGENSTGQSIPNNTNTICAFDTNVVDSYSGHSVVTNNSRYTCQIAGWYRLTFSATFAANGTGRRLGGIFKNGAEANDFRFETAAASAASGRTNVLCTNMIQLIVGDYIEGYVFQNSGGALALSSGVTTTTFSAIWVHA